jgi:hypothetical protein
MGGAAAQRYEGWTISHVLMDSREPHTMLVWLWKIDEEDRERIRANREGVSQEIRNSLFQQWLKKN